MQCHPLPHSICILMEVAMVMLITSQQFYNEDVRIYFTFLFFGCFFFQS